jgi:F-type H+-transporting ATPase subunit delta
VKLRDRGAARRYARALLDVATEQERATETGAALRQATSLLGANAALAAALAHPTLPIERKRSIVNTVFGGGTGDALLVRLLDLLITRGRLDLLADVEQAYADAWNARRGVVIAEAVTAQALSAAQQDRLSRALAVAARGEVELTAAVDPQVLGGLRVTMGGRIYDGTVRARLNGLRRHLEGDR